jgi:hypothetical protein
MTHLRGPVIRHVKRSFILLAAEACKSRRRTAGVYRRLRQALLSITATDSSRPRGGSKGELQLPRNSLSDSVAASKNGCWTTSHSLLVNVERETGVLSLQHSLFRNPSTKCLTSGPHQASLDYYPCPNEGNFKLCTCESKSRFTGLLQPDSDDHVTPPRFGQSLYMAHTVARNSG